MSTQTSRRRFLESTLAGGAILGLGDLSFMRGLEPISAGEAKLDAKMVRLLPEIEPLVRFLEDTPRERLLEEVAARIRRGLSYREILAALLLAGVRNVQPRPYVGFKFHAVLVVNSAHLASLSSPSAHRWLPIFWALDYFKDAQARDEMEGNWTMPPVDESRLPPAHRAKEAFTRAMDNWDETGADAAAAALARTAGAHEVFELFSRYGARDFRSIGHKAIFVANSWRTLNCIGWHHAEPVLRSLAYALLQHEGENPAKRDAAPDRPWRKNQELRNQIRKGWQDGKPSSEATVDLLATLRQGSTEDISKKAVEMLNRNVAPRSIWDAFFSGAGELLMRQPGIVALHAVTSTNALHFAYETSGNDATRRSLLLQNGAFLVSFREAMRERGAVNNELRIDQLEPLATETSGSEAISEIFGDVSDERLRAARKVLSHLTAHPDPKELIDAARVLVFLKGSNSHDYKFSSAVLEDCYHLSPGWRERYLASSVFKLRGAGEEDTPLVKRTRAALKA